MTHQNLSPKPAREQTTDMLLEPMLNALAKALKALTFYPAGHPQRNESIAAAYKQIIPFTRDRELVLLWSRDGCSVDENPDVKSRSVTAKALTREMLTRKLQRLTILSDVTEKDLLAFLSLISTESAVIHANGGIENEMIRAGIRTIGANEVDLSTLRGQQEEIDTQEEPDTGLSDEEDTESVEEEESPPEEEPEDEQNLQLSLLGLDILLGMLKGEKKDSQFLQLAREVIDTAEALKRQEAFDSLLSAIETLLDEYAAETRPVTQKEYIRYALEQIASGSMTTFLLDKIEERSAENEAVLDRLCTTLGQTLAYPLIQRLCVVETLHARKAIAMALTRSGEAAIPALIPMLKDERWYVVRNMVTILGEIGSADAVSALQMTARHPEPKVRKEVIKAFLKINTTAGENVLIALMNDDDDDEVVKQAIHSLGVIRSRIALRPLLEIVTTSDPFLKELPLKKHAILAIGRIGDRQATATLMDLLECKGWLAPGRWQELKISVATALGQLGDETAIPLLKKLAKRDSPLGNACSDATDNIERLAK